MINNEKQEGIQPIFKKEGAVFLGHQGLGDYITNIGAIQYLLNYYNTIFFICRQQHQDNVKLLFNNYSVVTIPILEGTQESSETQNCKLVLDKINSDEIDIFISGRCHTSYFQSKITHPQLLAYKQDDKGFTSDYCHIRDFYYDVGLDLSIYVNHFNIPTSETSLLYYQKIKQYNIVFLHTKASNYEINIDHIIEKYYNNDEYIIICANKNVYQLDHKYYEIAKQYVNIYVAYYIDIIKHAEIIHVIDSCFSCIVYPLMKKKNLSSFDVNIINR